MGECGPCPVFASFTLAFALQLRKKAWKTLSQVKKKPQSGHVRPERFNKWPNSMTDR